MSNDLSPMWVKDNLREESVKFERVRKVYVSLVNKETTYAHGIKRMLEIRKRIVAIWFKESKTPPAEEMLSEAAQPTTAPCQNNNSTCCKPAVAEVITSA